MDNNRKYLVCRHCGNLIGMIADSGVIPVCCGDPMEQLVPNTVDAAVEKHVPVVSKSGDQLIVTVGSVEHPMTPEHFIAWIAVAQPGRTQQVSLSPGEHPAAEFGIHPEQPATVYAYCNLHGLWSAEI